MKYLKSKSIITFFVLIFTFALFYQYFISGIYKWHIAQVGNYVSIIYVLSVSAGAYLLNSRRIKYSILIGSILLYSIFTGISGSLLLVIYYVLGFYLLGLKYYKSGLAIQLSYGLIHFLLLRSLLSIISNNLILNEVIFIVVVSIICHTTIKSREVFSNISTTKIPLIDNNIIFLVIALVTVGLNIATSNYGHDSLWYPLRSNALYFYNNFFTDNGFYGQVHYYPKLWESLTNNIFVEYNYSYGLSLSASLYVVLAVIIYSLFDKNKKVNSLIVITTPVVIGLSFSLKTDLLLLVVFLVAFIGVEKRRYDIVASAILLAFCIKNSAVVFSLAILAYIYLNKKDTSVYKDTEKNNYIIISLSFVVFSLFLFRTYLLTGVLVASPDSLVNIQEILGFEYDLPKRVYNDAHNSVFDIYKMIVLPESLGSHRFFYNGYLWAASVFVMDGFIAILLLLVLVVAYSVSYLGDGNYYVVLTVLLTVAFLRKVRIEKLGYLIIILNIVISIVANPNWVVPKVPSIKNVCNTIFCSDENDISRLATYHKVSALRNVINDKSKKYFVISKDENQVIWKLFHRYNVAHIQEFNVWNKIMPVYTLQQYLNKHIDVVIIESDYNYNGGLSGFEKFKVDDKYSYHLKK